jgi:anti-sigma factor RsiW
MEHPTAERLEAFAEGLLKDGERAVIGSHLLGCARCETDVEEWRSLFAVLRTLPSFAPAPGFALRVMAHVRIPQPWYARASALIDRMLPRTTGGWAVAAAILALPLLAGASFMAWLLSKSYVTVQGLWVFATDLFASEASRLGSRAVDAFVATDLAAWLAQGLDAAFGTGTREMGVVAVAGAGLTALSIWVLYRYLFRTPNRDSNYAMFSF